MNYYDEIGTRFITAMSGAGFLIGLVYLPFLMDNWPYLSFDLILMTGAALTAIKAFGQLKVVKLKPKKTGVKRSSGNSK